MNPANGYVLHWLFILVIVALLYEALLFMLWTHQGIYSWLRGSVILCTQVQHHSRLLSMQQLILLREAMGNIMFSSLLQTDRFFLSTLRWSIIHHFYLGLHFVVYIMASKDLYVYLGHSKPGYTTRKIQSARTSNHKLNSCC